MIFQEERTKVLLVEDDSYLLSLYANKFDQNNFEVISATDGLKALRLWKKYKPAVIVLDLNLPEMNGWEVLEVIAKDSDINDSICVILSNYDQDLAEEQHYLPDIVKAYFVKIKTTPYEVVDAIGHLLATTS